jgi:uncharacterized damage-inducible protein DinB
MLSNTIDSAVVGRFADQMKIGGAEAGRHPWVALRAGGQGRLGFGVFYSVQNFLDTWRLESATTARVLGSLTDASLEVRPTDAARSLGELAWHVVTAIREIGALAILPLSGPRQTKGVPGGAEEIRATYARCSRELVAAAAALSDSVLLSEVDVYGEEWAVGRVLYVLLAHEIHHRGQIVLLMRVADLPVPSVYGPSSDEWAQGKPR